MIIHKLISFKHLYSTLFLIITKCILNLNVPNCVDATIYTFHVMNTLHAVTSISGNSSSTSSLKEAKRYVFQSKDYKNKSYRQQKYKFDSSYDYSSIKKSDISLASHSSHYAKHLDSFPSVKVNDHQLSNHDNVECNQMPNHDNDSLRYRRKSRNKYMNNDDETDLVSNGSPYNYERDIDTDTYTERFTTASSNDSMNFSLNTAAASMNTMTGGGSPGGYDRGMSYERKGRERGTIDIDTDMGKSGSIVLGKDRVLVQFNMDLRWLGLLLTDKNYWLSLLVKGRQFLLTNFLHKFSKSKTLKNEMLHIVSDIRFKSPDSEHPLKSFYGTLDELFEFSKVNNKMILLYIEDGSGEFPASFSSTFRRALSDTRVSQLINRKFIFYGVTTKAHYYFKKIYQIYSKLSRFPILLILTPSSDAESSDIDFKSTIPTFPSKSRSNRYKTDIESDNNSEYRQKQQKQIHKRKLPLSLMEICDYIETNLFAAVLLPPPELDGENILHFLHSILDNMGIAYDDSLTSFLKNNVQNIFKSVRNSTGLHLSDPSSGHYELDEADSSSNRNDQSVLSQQMEQSQRNKKSNELSLDSVEFVPIPPFLTSTTSSPSLSSSIELQSQQTSSLSSTPLNINQYSRIDSDDDREG